MISNSFSKSISFIKYGSFGGPQSCASTRSLSFLYLGVCLRCYRKAQGWGLATSNCTQLIGRPRISLQPSPSDTFTRLRTSVHNHAYLFHPREIQYDLLEKFRHDDKLRVKHAIVYVDFSLAAPLWFHWRALSKVCGLLVGHNGHKGNIEVIRDSRMELSQAHVSRRAIFSSSSIPTSTRGTLFSLSRAIKRLLVVPTSSCLSSQICLEEVLATGSISVSICWIWPDWSGCGLFDWGLADREDWFATLWPLFCCWVPFLLAIVVRLSTLSLPTVALLRNRSVNQSEVSGQMISVVSPTTLKLCAWVTVIAFWYVRYCCCDIGVEKPSFLSDRRL